MCEQGTQLPSRLSEALGTEDPGTIPRGEVIGRVCCGFLCQIIRLSDSGFTPSVFEGKERCQDHPRTSLILTNLGQGAAIFFTLSKFCVLRNNNVHSNVYSQSAIFLPHSLATRPAVMPEKSRLNLPELKSTQETLRGQIFQ